MPVSTTSDYDQRAHIVAELRRLGLENDRLAELPVAELAELRRAAWCWLVVDPGED